MILGKINGRVIHRRVKIIGMIGDTPEYELESEW